MPAPVHARTKVRRGAKQLLTGLTSTGANVFIGRTRPLGEAHEDCLLVYGRETVTRVEEQGDPATGGHEFTLYVEGRLSRTARNADDDPSEALEEALDQVELEVTAALLAPRAFANLDPPVPVHAIFLRRSTLSAQAPGSRHEGEVRLEFGVQFFTPESDLSTFA